jgi:hypothetical protein
MCSSTASAGASFVEVLNARVGALSFVTRRVQVTSGIHFSRHYREGL